MGLAQIAIRRTALNLAASTRRLLRRPPLVAAAFILWLSRGERSSLPRIAAAATTGFVLGATWSTAYGTIAIHANALATGILWGVAGALAFSPALLRVPAGAGRAWIAVRGSTQGLLVAAISFAVWYAQLQASYLASDRPWSPLVLVGDIPLGIFLCLAGAAIGGCWALLSPPKP